MVPLLAYLLAGSCALFLLPYGIGKHLGSYTLNSDFPVTQ